MIARRPYTNHLASGAMRGYSACQVHFAHEIHMDEVANALNIDPLELRRMNEITPYYTGPTGLEFTSCRFDEAKRWYDGYSFSKEKSVYSPNSVVQAVQNEEFGDYWTETETYESLKSYIDLNVDGLRDTIILMLGGERCKINTRTFQNDMSSINSKDDVLTLLVHLGYLAYDAERREVYIPNQEVADEFKNAAENSDWSGISEALCRQSFIGWN